MNEKQLADLIAMFKSEASDHLATLNRDLLALERSTEEGERGMLLEEIFRAAHSLKGAARAVGFSQVESIAHRLESVFGAARRDQVALNSAVCDVLYEGLDAVEAILSGSQGLEEAPAELDDLVERLDAAGQGRVAPHPERAAISPPAAEPAVVTPPVQELSGDAGERKAEQAGPGEVVQPPAARLEDSLAGVGEAMQLPTVRPEDNLAGVGEAMQLPPARPEDGLAGASETIRVNVDKIEALMAQTGELLVSKIGADQRLLDLKTLRAELERQRKELRQQASLRRSHNGRNPESGAVIHLLDSYQSALSECAARLAALEKQLTGDALRLGLVTSNLQDGVWRMRMLPFSTILGGFQRMIRDLARELGKDAVLDVQGAEIELDKKVLEEIRDPIMHLLRNAIDHGIEAPSEREARGKPRGGIIRLAIAHEGTLISITVEDDGRGIDLQAVRKQAAQAGVMSRDELKTLSDEDAIHLILLPDITTRRQVTGVSGRGIGLDVVRQKVQDLHGQIEIKNQPGQGARFRLTVPVSLATTQGLLIRIMGETYALPLSAIEKAITVRSADVHTVTGREMVPFNQRPIALARLADVLERPELVVRSLDAAPAIVIRSGVTQAAFLVDELLGEQEMVVKGLGKQLVHVRNVTGATLLGSGQVVIILNPAELIRSTQQRGTHGQSAFVAPTTKPEASSTILVVDDSITTRTLEKNILEAAGYQVITAIDGVEALGYLTNNGCDLVVADIQMPRMNGFELTETVKRHDDLSHLPVILVTSLESPEDKKRGLAAGADAYIVKSAFDQEDLLSTIRQLL